MMSAMASPLFAHPLPVTSAASGGRTPDFFVGTPPGLGAGHPDVMSLAHPGNETPAVAELLAPTTDAIMEQLRAKLRELSYSSTGGDLTAVAPASSLEFCDLRKMPLPQFVLDTLPPAPGLPPPPVGHDHPSEAIGLSQATDPWGFSDGGADTSRGHSPPPPPAAVMPRNPQWTAPASTLVVSLGTAGHPTRFGGACGCLRGSSCPGCHLREVERAPMPPPLKMWEVGGAAPPEYSEDSVGSIGHPWSCAQACKFYDKPRGCKDGAGCVRCHRCVWRRCQRSMRSGQR
mmetsp:Transcript_45194/g.130513  ORF Transcript_45194/g.130513 Transcript_45194/m.130513 type:complete len:288 (-) Transcript_45194:112-975(-)